MHAGVRPLVGMVEWHLRGDPEAKDQWSAVHRQWSERFSGRRSPSSKLAKEIEARCPGTAAVLSLALWPALRLDIPLSDALAAAEKRLEARQRRLFAALVYPDPKAPATAVQAYRKPVLDMALSATLDDLACLLMLLRLSIEQGREGSARLLAENVFVALLVQAPWLLDHGLLVPMADYVERHFFKRVVHPWVRWLSAEGYLSAVEKVARRLDADNAGSGSQVPYEAWKPAVLQTGFAWELVSAMGRCVERRAMRDQTSAAGR